MGQPQVEQSATDRRPTAALSPHMGRQPTAELSPHMGRRPTAELSPRTGQPPMVQPPPRSGQQPTAELSPHMGRRLIAALSPHMGQPPAEALSPLAARTLRPRRVEAYVLPQTRPQLEAASTRWVEGRLARALAPEGPVLEGSEEEERILAITSSDPRRSGPVPRPEAVTNASSGTAARYVPAPTAG